MDDMTQYKDIKIKVKIMQMVSGNVTAENVCQNHFMFYCSPNQCTSK